MCIRVSWMISGSCSSVLLSELMDHDATGALNLANRVPDSSGVFPVAELAQLERMQVDRFVDVVQLLVVQGCAIPFARARYCTLSYALQGQLGAVQVFTQPAHHPLAFNGLGNVYRADNA